MVDSPTFPVTPDFESLFQSAPGLYLVLTPDFNIVAVSDAYLRATLTKREDILGRGVFEVFPDNPNDPLASGVRNLRTSLERVLEGKVADTMAVQKYDIRKPESEGGEFEERYWSSVNSPVSGPHKEVRYIIHCVQDVTEFVRLKQQGIEQRKLTDDLKAEERFHKAFNASPEPITIANLSDGRYLDVNESFLRTTGYRREEVIGRTSLELKFWERREDRARLVAILEEQGSVRDLEITFCTKSGEQRTALDSAEIIEVAGQKCIIAFFKDITERKFLEQQLRQAQKMEAVGRLSGGIAHDFNNLLGVIIGYSELLGERVAQNASLRKNVEEIKKAGHRAADLTRQLLAFSRQQVLDPKVLDLNAIVAGLEKMLRPLIGEDIELSTALDPALGHVKADQGQIEQVIMNLVINGRDAMPEGGKLMIETASVDLDEDYARRHPPVVPGSYALLAVTDTGMGMDAKTQAHIFDPFFTTKEMGKGTGLGLATVYGVVKQSGGYIWVDSEPGKGTTFKTYLPLVEESPEPAGLRATRAKPSRGSETILLVEDEESLRVMTRTLLVQSGYNVLDADSGTQALEIAHRREETIHLLLTDVVLPGMRGRELAERMVLFRPNLRVLLMSGYADHAMAAQGVLDAGTFFLQKPFTRDALTREVRKVLDFKAAVKV